MLDYDSFLSEHRSCLIAPAGFGKTYTIVECLKRTTGRQLILTHTHAGVAALREKIHSARISSSRYELSTISAIAQKLAICFTPKHLIKTQEESGYFNWCIERAAVLVRQPMIANIFRISYDGVFVDEYQDCTISQHKLLLMIAEKLPLRVFGDQMQGIFGFDEPIVDFEADMVGFVKYRLTEPKRWEKTNPGLGEEIYKIRKCLETGVTINEAEYHTIQFKKIKTKELQMALMKLCYELPKGESALVLVSNSRSRQTRCNVAKLFGGHCSIVEAIDDREFYEQAKLVDSIDQGNCTSILYSIASSLFFKTHVDKWLSASGTIRKKLDADREVSVKLVKAVEELKRNPSAITLLECIEALLHISGVVILSHEKCYSLVSSIRCATETGTTVLDAMCDARNAVRGMGRRMRPFSVGSTLLTKGLEFDHVIVCDYNPGFNLDEEGDKRNFYVAISRACKSLTIVRSDSPEIRLWQKHVNRRMFNGHN